MWYPLFIAATLLFYGVSQPYSSLDVGFMFFYPIYDDTRIQSLFTSGSWLGVFFLCWLLESELNKTFNKKVFKIVVNSSMYTYLAHDFFITVVAFFLLKIAPETN